MTKSSEQDGPLGCSRWLRELRRQLLRVDGEGKALTNPAGVITAESGALCLMLAVSKPQPGQIPGPRQTRRRDSLSFSPRGKRQITNISCTMESCGLHVASFQGKKKTTFRKLRICGNKTTTRRYFSPYPLLIGFKGPLCVPDLQGCAFFHYLLHLVLPAFCFSEKKGEIGTLKNGDYIRNLHPETGETFFLFSFQRRPAW